MMRDPRRRSPESSRRRRRERRDDREQIAGTTTSTLPGPSAQPQQYPYLQSHLQQYPQSQNSQYYAEPQRYPESESIYAPRLQRYDESQEYGDPQRYPQPELHTQTERYPETQTDHDRDRDAEALGYGESEVMRPRGGSSSSASSSTSSSFLNISAKNSKFGGVFSTFWRAPSEQRKKRRKKKQKARILSFGNSSSSSVNSDLAYGRGYIERDKSQLTTPTPSAYASPTLLMHQEHIQPRQEPKPAPQDKTDEEILAIGRQLQDIARRQNDADLRAANKSQTSKLAGAAGIAGAAAAFSHFYKNKANTKTRRAGSTNPKDKGSSSDDDWESASDDESSTDSSESSDAGLAYGSDSKPSKSARISSEPPEQIKPPGRKNTVVDPRLFGPYNSLRGAVKSPCGFGEEDPRSAGSFRRHHEETVAQVQSPKTGKQPMQHVFPVPTSDPSKFDFDRGSVTLSRQELPQQSRPSPVPLQQPIPIVPVSSKVYNADVFGEDEPSNSKRHPPNGRSAAENAIAGVGVAAAAIGAEMANRSDSAEYHEHHDDRRSEFRERRDGLYVIRETRRTEERAERADRSVRIELEDLHPRRSNRRSDVDIFNDGNDVYDQHKRRAARADVPHEPTKKREAATDSRPEVYRLPRGYEIRVELDPDEERRRREVPKEACKEERKPDRKPEGFEERRDAERVEKPSELPRDYHGVEQPEDPITQAAIDPFQFQVADDAFQTPKYATPKTATPKRPLTPQVVTVDREPNFDDPSSRKPDYSDARMSRKDSFELEKRLEQYQQQGFRDLSRNPELRRRKSSLEEDEHAVKSIYDDAKHATAPLAAAALASAIAVKDERSPKHRGGNVTEDNSRDTSQAVKDAVQQEADRYYRETVLARKIAEDEIRSRSSSPHDESVVGKWQDHEEGPEVVTIATPPEMDHPHDQSPYDAPNADVRIDHIIIPNELHRFRLPDDHLAAGAAPIFRSRDPSCDRERPLLNLVLPTPLITPRATPAPEQEKVAKPTTTTHETVKPRSVETMGSSTDLAPEVILESQGEVDKTPTTPAAKSVTWGENETKSFEAEGTEPPRSTPVTASTKSKSKKGFGMSSPCDINAAASGGSGAAAASSSSVAPQIRDPFEESNPEEEKVTHSPPQSLKSRVVEASTKPVVAPLPPNLILSFDVEQDLPPAPGPKPSSPRTSQMPGAFADDLEFASVLAAGLQDTGFDPNIVIDNPTYMKRDSPPRQSEPLIYQQPFAETVTDLGIYGHDHIQKRSSTREPGFIIGEVPETPGEEKDLQNGHDAHGASPKQKRDKGKAKETAFLNEELAVDDFQPARKLSKKEKRKQKAAQRQRGDNSLVEVSRDASEIAVPPEPTSVPERVPQHNWHRNYKDVPQSPETVVALGPKSHGLEDAPARDLPASSHRDLSFEEPTSLSTTRPVDEPSFYSDQSFNEQTSSREQEAPLSRPTPSDVPAADDDTVFPIKSSKEAKKKTNLSSRSHVIVVQGEDGRPVEEFVVEESRTSREKLTEHDDHAPIERRGARDDPPDTPKRKKNPKKSRPSSDEWTKVERQVDDASVAEKSEKNTPTRATNDWNDGPTTSRRDRSKFEDNDDMSSVVSDPSSRREKSYRRSKGTKHEDDDAKSVASDGTSRKRRSCDDNKSPRDEEKRSSGSFFSLFRPGSGSSKNTTGKDEKSFLDDAGTLGAGAGLASAVAALGSMMSRSNATEPHPEELSDTHRHWERSASPLRDVDILDPEITQRAIRPAIDPQYGDLLPLPPSPMPPNSPGSPTQDLDELPVLPDSRPETPPEERRRHHEMKTHARRRSNLETPHKSPSQTAVPFKLRLGQRSTPSSPGNLGQVISPVSPPTVPTVPEPTISRRPSIRPISWERGSEIKPLYLLEHARQEHAAQLMEPPTIDFPELPPSEPSSLESPALEFALRENDVNYLQRLQPSPLEPDDLRINTDLSQFHPSVGYHGSQETKPKAVHSSQHPGTIFGPESPALPAIPDVARQLDLAEHDLVELPALPDSPASLATESDAVSPVRPATPVIKLVSVVEIPALQSSPSIEAKSIEGPSGAQYLSESPALPRVPDAARQLGLSEHDLVDLPALPASPVVEKTMLRSPPSESTANLNTAEMSAFPASAIIGSESRALPSITKFALESPALPDLPDTARHNNLSEHQLDEFPAFPASPTSESKPLVLPTTVKLAPESPALPVTPGAVRHINLSERQLEDLTALPVTESDVFSPAPRYLPESPILPCVTGAASQLQGSEHELNNLPGLPASPVPEPEVFFTGVNFLPESPVLPLVQNATKQLDITGHELDKLPALPASPMMSSVFGTEIEPETVEAMFKNRNTPPSPMPIKTHHNAETMPDVEEKSLSGARDAALGALVGGAAVGLATAALTRDHKAGNKLTETENDAHNLETAEFACSPVEMKLSKKANKEKKKMKNNRILMDDTTLPSAEIASSSEPLAKDAASSTTEIVPPTSTDKDQKSTSGSVSAIPTTDPTVPLTEASSSASVDQDMIPQIPTETPLPNPSEEEVSRPMDDPNLPSTTDAAPSTPVASPPAVGEDRVMSPVSRGRFGGFFSRLRPPHMLLLRRSQYGSNPPSPYGSAPPSPWIHPPSEAKMSEEPVIKTPSAEPPAAQTPSYEIPLAEAPLSKVIETRVPISESPIIRPEDHDDLPPHDIALTKPAEPPSLTSKEAIRSLSPTDKTLPFAGPFHPEKSASAAKNNEGDLSTDIVQKEKEMYQAQRSVPMTIAAATDSSVPGTPTEDAPMEKKLSKKNKQLEKAPAKALELARSLDNTEPSNKTTSPNEEAPVAVQSEAEVTTLTPDLEDQVPLAEVDGKAPQVDAVTSLVDTASTIPLLEKEAATPLPEFEAQVPLPNTEAQMPIPQSGGTALPTQNAAITLLTETEAMPRLLGNELQSPLSATEELVSLPSSEQAKDVVETDSTTLLPVAEPPVSDTPQTDKEDVSDSVTPNTKQDDKLINLDEKATSQALEAQISAFGLEEGSVDAHNAQEEQQTCHSADDNVMDQQTQIRDADKKAVQVDDLPSEPQHPVVAQDEKPSQLEDSTMEQQARPQDVEEKKAKMDELQSEPQTIVVEQEEKSVSLEGILLNSDTRLPAEEDRSLPADYVSSARQAVGAVEEQDPVIWDDDSRQTQAFVTEGETVPANLDDKLTAQKTPLPDIDEFVEEAVTKACDVEPLTEPPSPVLSTKKKRRKNKGDKKNQPDEEESVIAGQSVPLEADPVLRQEAYNLDAEANPTYNSKLPAEYQDLNMKMKPADDIKQVLFEPVRDTATPSTFEAVDPTKSRIVAAPATEESTDETSFATPETLDAAPSSANAGEKPPSDPATFNAEPPVEPSQPEKSGKNRKKEKKDKGVSISQHDDIVFGEMTSVQLPTVGTPVVKSPVLGTSINETPTVETRDEEASSINKSALEISNAENPAVDIPIGKSTLVETYSSKTSSGEAAIETGDINRPAKELAPEISKAEFPTAQTPVVKSPLLETPLVETPTGETTVETHQIQDLCDEKYVPETSTRDIPAIETPVAENPVAETPLVETPTASTASAEEPVLKTGSPSAQFPSVETHVTSVVETPIVETPTGGITVETPVGENPVVGTSLLKAASVEELVPQNSAETSFGQILIVEAPVIEDQVVETLIVETQTLKIAVKTPAVETQADKALTAQLPTKKSQATVETQIAETPVANDVTVESLPVEAPILKESSTTKQAAKKPHQLAQPISTDTELADNVFLQDKNQHQHQNKDIEDVVTATATLESLQDSPTDDVDQIDNVSTPTEESSMSSKKSTKRKQEKNLSIAESEPSVIAPSDPPAEAPDITKQNPLPDSKTVIEGDDVLAQGVYFEDSQSQSRKTEREQPKERRDWETINTNFQDPKVVGSQNEFVDLSHGRVVPEDNGTVSESLSRESTLFESQTEAAGAKPKEEPADKDNDGGIQAQAQPASPVESKKSKKKKKAAAAALQATLGNAPQKLHDNKQEAKDVTITNKDTQITPGNVGVTEPSSQDAPTSGEFAPDSTISEEANSGSAVTKKGKKKKKGKKSSTLDPEPENSPSVHVPENTADVANTMDKSAYFSSRTGEPVSDEIPSAQANPSTLAEWPTAANMGAKCKSVSWEPEVGSFSNRFEFPQDADTGSQNQSRNVSASDQLSTMIEPRQCQEERDAESEEGNVQGSVQGSEDLLEPDSESQAQTAPVSKFNKALPLPKPQQHDIFDPINNLPSSSGPGSENSRGSMNGSNSTRQAYFPSAHRMLPGSTARAVTASSSAVRAHVANQKGGETPQRELDAEQVASSEADATNAEHAGHTSAIDEPQAGSNAQMGKVGLIDPGLHATVGSVSQQGQNKSLQDTQNGRIAGAQAVGAALTDSVLEAGGPPNTPVPGLANQDTNPVIPQPLHAVVDEVPSSFWFDKKSDAGITGATETYPKDEKLHDKSNIEQLGENKQKKEDEEEQSTPFATDAERPGRTDTSELHGEPLISESQKLPDPHPTGVTNSTHSSERSETKAQQEYEIRVEPISSSNMSKKDRKNNKKTKAAGVEPIPQDDVDEIKAQQVDNPPVVQPVDLAGAESLEQKEPASISNAPNVAPVTEATEAGEDEWAFQPAGKKSKKDKKKRAAAQVAEEAARAAAQTPETPQVVTVVPEQEAQSQPLEADDTPTTEITKGDQSTLAAESNESPAETAGGQKSKKSKRCQSLTESVSVPEDAATSTDRNTDSPSRPTTADELLEWPEDIGAIDLKTPTKKITKDKKKQQQQQQDLREEDQDRFRPVGQVRSRFPWAAPAALLAGKYRHVNIERRFSEPAERESAPKSPSTIVDPDDIDLRSEHPKDVLPSVSDSQPIDKQPEEPEISQNEQPMQPSESLEIKPPAQPAENPALDEPQTTREANSDVPKELETPLPTMTDTTTIDIQTVQPEDVCPVVTKKSKKDKKKKNKGASADDLEEQQSPLDTEIAPEPSKSEGLSEQPIVPRTSDVSQQMEIDAEDFTTNTQQPEEKPAREQPAESMPLEEQPLEEKTVHNQSAAEKSVESEPANNEGFAPVTKKSKKDKKKKKAAAAAQETFLRQPNEPEAVPDVTPLPQELQKPRDLDTAEKDSPEPSLPAEQVTVVESNIPTVADNIPEAVIPEQRENSDVSPQQDLTINPEEEFPLPEKKANKDKKKNGKKAQNELMIDLLPKPHLEPTSQPEETLSREFETAGAGEAIVPQHIISSEESSREMEPVQDNTSVEQNLPVDLHEEFPLMDKEAKKDEKRGKRSISAVTEPEPEPQVSAADLHEGFAAVMPTEHMSVVSVEGKAADAPMDDVPVDNRTSSAEKDQQPTTVLQDANVNDEFSPTGEKAKRTKKKGKIIGLTEPETSSIPSGESAKSDVGCSSETPPVVESQPGTTDNGPQTPQPLDDELPTAKVSKKDKKKNKGKLQDDSELLSGVVKPLDEMPTPTISKPTDISQTEALAIKLPITEELSKEAPTSPTPHVENCAFPSAANRDTTVEKESAQSIQHRKADYHEVSSTESQFLAPKALAKVEEPSIPEEYAENVVKKDKEETSAASGDLDSEPIAPSSDQPSATSKEPATTGADITITSLPTVEATAGDSLHEWAEATTSKKSNKNKKKHWSKVEPEISRDIPYEEPEIVSKPQGTSSLSVNDSPTSPLQDFKLEIRDVTKKSPEVTPPRTGSVEQTPTEEWSDVAITKEIKKKRQSVAFEDNEAGSPLVPINSTPKVKSLEPKDVQEQESPKSVLSQADEVVLKPEFGIANVSDTLVKIQPIVTIPQSPKSATQETFNEADALREAITHPVLSSSDITERSLKDPVEQVVALDDNEPEEKFILQKTKTAEIENERCSQAQPEDNATLTPTVGELSASIPPSNHPLENVQKEETDGKGHEFVDVPAITDVDEEITSNITTPSIAEPKQAEENASRDIPVPKKPKKGKKQPDPIDVSSSTNIELPPALDPESNQPGDDAETPEYFQKPILDDNRSASAPPAPEPATTIPKLTPMVGHEQFDNTAPSPKLNNPEIIDLKPAQESSSVIHDAPFDQSNQRKRLKTREPSETLLSEPILSSREIPLAYPKDHMHKNKPFEQGTRIPEEPSLPTSTPDTPQDQKQSEPKIEEDAQKYRPPKAPSARDIAPSYLEHKMDHEAAENARSTRSIEQLQPVDPSVIETAAGVTAVAAGAALSSKSNGKKKGNKNQSSYSDKYSPAEDDMFDDPSLGEDADKNQVSEIASAEVGNFRSGGVKKDDVFAPTSKQDDSVPIQDRQTGADSQLSYIPPPPIGGSSTTSESRSPMEKTGLEPSKHKTRDALSFKAPIQDKAQDENVESPVLGREMKPESKTPTERNVDRSLSSTLGAPKTSTMTSELDGVVDRGYEVESRRDLSSGRPLESPFRSPVPSILPPVLEEAQEESKSQLPSPPKTASRRALRTPEPQRDSGLGVGTCHAFRGSGLGNQESEQDSGVVRDWQETRWQGRDTGRTSELSSHQERQRSRELERVKSPAVKETSRRSPLGEEETRDYPLSRTPVLREPSRQELTPTPESHKMRRISPELERRRSKYQDLASAALAGAAISSTSSPRSTPPPGNRSVSERVARLQSPAPVGPPLARRSISNSSLSRHRRAMGSATPEPLKFRPESPGIPTSRPATATPPLRRADRRMSGDLRSLSQRSHQDLIKDPTSTPTPASSSNTPVANEGRVRTKDMADVYDGFGEGRIGSPRSPTRPHSMRRRQSMQVLELESRVEQLMAENRLLADARIHAESHNSNRASGILAERDAEIDILKQSLEFLQKEVARLTEVNEGLNSANAQLAAQHNERYRSLETQHADVARQLKEARNEHSHFQESLLQKDAEIGRLRSELDAAKDKIRQMQRQILAAKGADADFLNVKDVDHFDHRCQQLCSHVQQWVLRFSKFSDMRACRLTNEINDEKVIDRLDNAILDGSDVDAYLADRVRRRDVFMSMTMNMIWEFVFTRYLFGMDREQRQKLKSLEKLLTEVGPPQAVRQWRAVTLTLLSKRPSFKHQRDLDTEAVVQAIFQTLSKVLPPPSNLEDQIQSQLRRVMREAVDLSIEMRTQRAEYMMLPPLQPEYDADGELAETVTFNAALMNERSGDKSVTNEELEAQNATVRIVLFPLVVKKGDDAGNKDDEIVVRPAQVLVARSKGKSAQLFTLGSDVGGASLVGGNSAATHSDLSMGTFLPEHASNRG